MPETAIVIVHMQPIMTFTLKEREESLLLSQENVLDHCAQNDYPVLTIEWPSEDETIKRIKEAYQKVPRNALVKRADTDGFNNSESDSILKNWNVKYIMPIGMWASGCAYLTAKGAKSHGYEIIFSLDCVEDRLSTDYEYVIQTYRDDFDAKVFYYHKKALAYMDELRKQ